MRAESTYTKLHKMCLWGLWNYSLQAAENTIIPILISQLKKLHRVGIYTASNLSYSDPLHAVGDCKKCSETAVGNVTQWIPSIFAVKRFAVCIHIQNWYRLTFTHCCLGSNWVAYKLNLIWVYDSKSKRTSSVNE